MLSRNKPIGEVSIQSLHQCDSGRTALSLNFLERTEENHKLRTADLRASPNCKVGVLTSHPRRSINLKCYTHSVSSCYEYNRVLIT
jgi:hypothetical protein